MRYVGRELPFNCDTQLQRSGVNEIVVGIARFIAGTAILINAHVDVGSMAVLSYWKPDDDNIFAAIKSLQRWQISDE